MLLKSQYPVLMLSLGIWKTCSQVAAPINLYLYKAKWGFKRSQFYLIVEPEKFGNLENCVRWQNNILSGSTQAVLLLVEHGVF